MQPSARITVTPGSLVWTVLPPERRVAVVSLLTRLAARAAAGATGCGRDEPGLVPDRGAVAAEGPPGAPGPGCDRLRPSVQQAAGARALGVDQNAGKKPIGNYEGR